MKLGIFLILFSLYLLFVLPGAIPKIAVYIATGEFAFAFGYGLITLGFGGAIFYYGIRRIRKHLAMKKKTPGQKQKDN
jgi:hypothetical protein